MSTAPPPAGPPADDADHRATAAAWRWGILLTAALVVIGVGLKAVSGIAGPVFLAINLVVAAYPLQVWLRRLRVPGWLANLVALIAVFAILIAIIGSVAWAATQLADAIPRYSKQFNDLYDSTIAWLAGLGLQEEQLREMLAKIDVNNFTGIAKTLLNTLSSGLSLLLLIVTVIIFVAMDAPSTESRLRWIERERPAIAAGLGDFGRNVRKYWVVSTIFGLIVAVIDVIALMIIGVPLAVTWGVLAFVTNYIPNIGFVLGLIPPALLALLDGGIGPMIAVIVAYAAINFVIQSIIQPKFTGDAVGINATTAFVSLVFWASILGPLGALLAIPATLFVKSVLLDHSPQAQWVSALISSRSTPDPPDVPDDTAGPPPGATPRHASPY